MGKTDSEECLYCPDDRNDAERTFFACGRWELQRQSLTGEVGQLSLETIVNTMLREDDCWSRIAYYEQDILRAKKPYLDSLRALF